MFSVSWPVILPGRSVLIPVIKAQGRNEPALISYFESGLRRKLAFTFPGIFELAKKLSLSVWSLGV